MSYNKLISICESSQEDYSYDRFISAILFIQEETHKPRSRYNYNIIEETLYHLEDVLPKVLEEYQEYLNDSSSVQEGKFYIQELSKINDMIVDVNYLIKKVLDFN